MGETWVDKQKAGEQGESTVANKSGDSEKEKSEGGSASGSGENEVTEKQESEEAAAQTIQG